MTALLVGHHDQSRSQTPSHTLFYALGLVLMGLCFLAMPAQAQDEEPEPTRYEDVTWNYAILVDYKPGKKGRAMEIVSNHFIPAYNQAGVPVPRTIEFQTGPWDVLLVGAMKDGPSQMTWETSPQQIKIRKALVEMMGSEEEVEKISEEYQSLIARSTDHLGFSGRYGPPIPKEMSE